MPRPSVLEIEEPCSRSLLGQLSDLREGFRRVGRRQRRAGGLRAARGVSYPSPSPSPIAQVRPTVAQKIGEGAQGDDVAYGVVVATVKGRLCDLPVDLYAKTQQGRCR